MARRTKRKTTAAPVPKHVRNLRMPAHPFAAGPLAPAAIDRRQELESRVDKFTAKFGPPLFAFAERGMYFYVFLINPDGWGMLDVRRSIQDTDGADSLFSQAEAVLEDLAALHQCPALLLVSEGISGQLDLEHRPDIAFIGAVLHSADLQSLRNHPGAFIDRWGKEAVDFMSRPGGWCEFVAFYSVDRMARNLLSGLRFTKVLEAIGINLFLTEEIKTSAVDWDRDKSFLLSRLDNAEGTVHGILGASERGVIGQLKDGRAPENRLPPGFALDSEGYPTDTLKGAAGKKLRRVQQAVHDLFRLFGEDCSSKEAAAYIKRTYRYSWQPSYCLQIVGQVAHVTGQITLADPNGELHELQPVKLVNAVTESAYRRANTLISVRERHGAKSADADYLAGGVRMYCAGCLEEFGIEGASEWGGRRVKRGNVYRRRDGQGCSKCRGWRPGKSELEAKLFAAFLDAAERLPGPVLATPEELDALRDKVDELEEKLDDLTAQMHPRPKDPEEHVRKFDRIVGNADLELAAARRRLAALETLEQMPLSTCPLYDRDLTLYALRELLRTEGWDDAYYRALIRKAFAETLDYIVIEGTREDWGLKLYGRAPAPGARNSQALYPLEHLRPLLFEFLVERRVDVRAEQAANAATRGKGHSGPQGMPRGPLCPSGVVARRRQDSRRAAPKTPLPPGVGAAWSRGADGELRLPDGDGELRVLVPGSA